MESLERSIGVAFLSLVILVFGSYTLYHLPGGNVDQVAQAVSLDSDPQLVGHYTYSPDGTSVATTITSTPQISVTGPSTFSAWFKATTGTSGSQLLWKNNSYGIGVTGSLGTGVNVTIRGGLSTDSHQVAVTSFLNTGWHLLTGVYDGSNLIIYMDGVQVGSKATTRTSIDANTNNLVINPNNYGSVDDVRIYSRALAANEVQTLFNNGTAAHPATQVSTGGTTSGGGTTGGGTTGGTTNPPPAPVVVNDVRSTAPPPVSWIPPFAIQEPSFGIRETHYMYQLQNGETCSSNPNKCFDFGSGPQPYHDAGNGPYSHYVDNTSPAATDTNNPFGNATVPRKTFPNLNTLPAGSVVEIHGGPYTGTTYITTQNGTAAQPIFIRGGNKDSKPTFTGMASFMVRGPYIILENIKFDGVNVDIRPWFITENVSHISFRHNESAGNISCAACASSYVDGNTAHDIVYYDNYVHASEADKMFLTPDAYENDTSGFYFGLNSNHVWILDNDVSGQGGDSIGGGHGVNYTAHHYYAGRNVFHHTGENAVDLKEVEDVVISQNKMYDFKGPSAGSDGTAVVIHYGPQYSPKNTWVLFNEIYNATDNGIQVGGDSTWPVYLIGNNIHDITNAAHTGWGFISWNSGEITLVNNTFTNVDNGLESQSVGGTNGAMIVKNNVIGPLLAPGGYSIKMTGRLYRDASIFNNLAFTQPAKVYWGTDYTLEGWKAAAPAQCTTCVENTSQYTSDPTIISDLNAKFKAQFDYDLNLAGGSVPNTEPPAQQPTPTTYKLGDFDKNGQVNTFDWSYMNSVWNTSDPTADLNKDGKVNTLDFAILIGNWTPL